MPACLILVPTRLERRLLTERLRFRGVTAPVACCGFGPVVAAARTAQLIAVDAPGRVLLAGIAGSLHPDLPVGSAWQFERVACHGVGAGSAADFVPAGRIGWQQWEGLDDGPDSAIGDLLALAGAAAPDGRPVTLPTAGLLLTACAAAAGESDVRDRRRCFPDAVAEDMEGFGVAAACRLAGVPLGIVRGISNRAGDRDTRRWRIDEAAAAAADLAADLLSAAAETDP
jgi:futalosine hydrolase